ncbi:MAG: endonuclease, partial [Gemmatimonadota bacterium]
ARVAVVGDLNTFEFTDDLGRMLPGSDGERVLTNLIRELPREERYTYIFQGNSQVLDHVFVSESLTDGARVEAVHLNSNLPSVRGTASDHDPVVASLRIP